MHLLFEEHTYPKDALTHLHLDNFLKETTASTAKCNYIGFIRDYDNDTLTFVLPKIFVKNGRILNRYPFHDFATTKVTELVTKIEFEIIRSLVEKLYFCLRQYQRDNPQSDIIDAKQGFIIRSNLGDKQTSSFEAMLSLIAFNKSSPYLHVQQRQIIDSRDPRHIDWKKTLSKCLPVSLTDGCMIYPDFIGKTQAVRRDDPLLTVYYSLLNEFKEYDPTIHFDTSVPTLSRTELSRKKAKIVLFLRNSKSLYFSDKFKQLHSLLQSYYLADRATYSTNRVEYLFTDDFDAVFEKMVDAILSDNELLQQYKYLKDGKEIDHLFGDADVFRGNKIIYIGDSKYYKDPTKISFQRHKQFTYARNIIQENIYIVNKGQETVYSRNYRDPISEGYNVTPNFFVLGAVADNWAETSFLIEPDSEPPELSFHFPNRLFDRDTLHIIYLKADFLKLLNFYIGREKRLSVSRRTERQKARSIIRENYIVYLFRHYSFFKIKLEKEYIESNFKLLNGRVYMSPTSYPSYVLALDKSRPTENAQLLKKLEVDGISPEEFSAENAEAF